MSGICSHQVIPVFLSVEEKRKNKGKNTISFNIDNETGIQHAYNKILYNMKNTT